MKEGKEEEKDSGESEAKHKAQEPPLTPTLILSPLITHTGTKESPFHGFSHGTQRSERQDRVRQKDGKRGRGGALLLKRASDCFSCKHVKGQ